MQYPGKPLGLGNAFRLLKLQPGQGTDPVVAELVNAGLDNAPDFEALSYTWGDQSLVTRIQVNQTISSHDATTTSMSITSNCHAALKRLRKADSVRVLWIDAICINQELLSERNHQLGLMRHIYARASRVVIYLGEASDESNTLLDWLQQNSQASDYGLSGFNHPAPPTREAFDAFLSRPWFHRVWVLQEITFAKALIALCGDRTLEWDVVKSLRNISGFGGWSFDIPYALSYRTPSFDYKWQFTSYGKRLLDMLVMSRHCKATDPRDKLYAILPLLDLSQERMLQQLSEKALEWRSHQDEDLNETALQLTLEVQPDYNLSPAHVFTDLSKSLMGTMGLDVLCSVSAPRNIVSLPSWVPDWSVCRTNRWYDEWYRSKAGLRMDQELWWNPRMAKYSDPSHDAWRLSEYIVHGGDTSWQLHLQAVNVGYITKIGPACNLAKYCFPMQQWWSLVASPEDPPQLLSPEVTHKFGSGSCRETYTKCRRAHEFWVALGCTLDPDIVIWIDGYVSRRSSNVNKRLMTVDYQLTADAKSQLFDSLKQRWEPSWVIRIRKFLERCDGRSLFVTDTGHVGLVDGDADIIIGDSVHVVEGVRKPLILRRHGSIAKADSSTETRGSLFELLGSAYIKAFGRMEIWERVNSSGGAMYWNEIIVR